MSVLIKGMKMPKHCWQCGLKDSDDECMATYAIDRQIESVDEVWGEQRVPDWCPLVEVPPPHGRLIDAGDAVITLKANKRENEAKGYILAADEDEIVRWIDKLPTIIEAEEGAENEIDRR